MTLIDKVKKNKFAVYVFFAIITTVVNVSVYMIVHDYIIDNIIISNVVAYTCSITLSFIINKNVVFKSKNGNVFVQLLLYLCVKFISFSVDSGVLFLLNKGLKIDNFIAKLVANASTTISNYVLNNKLVFKNK